MPHSRSASLRAALALVAALLLPAAAAAELPEITLGPGQGIYELGPHLEVLEDPSRSLTLEEIRRGDHGASFQPVHDEAPNFGFSSSAYWFRVTVHNRKEDEANWLLEVRNPMLDNVRLHLSYADGRAVPDWQSGDRVPFSERAVPYRFPVFLVPLEPGERVEMYLRVVSQGSVQVPVVLQSDRAFYETDHTEQLVFGMYYGLAVALLLYNLLLFASLREVNFLYYALYIATFALMLFTMNGLAFEYLWPRSMWWANRAVPLLIDLSVLTVLLFTRSFLELKARAPRWDWLAKTLIALSTAMIPVTLLGNYQLATKLVAVAGAVSPVFVLAVGAVMLFRGFRPARYFMLAWALFQVGVGLYALRAFGILPAMFVTEYSMQIGSATELILLSFALAHKMKLLEEENERVRNETQAMLEQRVAERTTELNEALDELSRANETLKALSTTDGLTGLRNRGYFDGRLAEEWQRARRGGTPLSLLMIDIDHFKRINDTHGHPVGDQILRAVAEILTGYTRRPADMAARYGGEEFVVLLPEAHAEGGRSVADAIRRTVAAEPLSEDPPIRVTCSIGVACAVPSDSNESDALVERADRALYRAKEAGRDRVVLDEAEPSTASIQGGC